MLRHFPSSPLAGQPKSNRPALTNQPRVSSPPSAGEPSGPRGAGASVWSYTARILRLDPVPVRAKALIGSPTDFLHYEI